MTVFVSCPPIPTGPKKWMPDLQPATQYGDLCFVFPGDVNNNPNAIYDAAKKLNNFVEERDFLLYPNCGDPATFWVCCMALVAIGCHEVTMLRWNRKKCSDANGNTIGGYYLPQKFIIPTEEEIDAL